MGQGASSARCPSTGALRPSLSPPPSSDMPSPNEREPPSSYRAATSSSIPVTSRRRSFSPDPDSVDSRRSSRIRRRISRFVSSNINADHVPGRDSIHSAGSADTSLETTATEALSSFAPRVRLARIRSGLLHRRRSLNTSNLDGTRRERPFSMITPRLGSLPFGLPRDTGSLDLPPSHTLRPHSTLDSDTYMISGHPTDSSRTHELPDLHIDNNPVEGVQSERNAPAEFFGPRRSISSSRHLRPRRAATSSEAFDAIAENPQNSEDTSTTLFPSASQSRSGSHRPPRDSRGSGSSTPSRLGRSGEDQAAVLSRLLSVAAAATAASLVGSNVQAFSDARDVSGDSVDGSFESFLRALQNGRLASALRNGGSTPDSLASDSSDDIISAGSIGPLNFFRMFRFGPILVNPATPAASTSTSGEEQARMVPVIIVGIRSVNPRDPNPRDGRPPAPFLDALPSTPALNDSDSRRGNSLPSRSQTSRSRHISPIENRDQNNSSALDPITSSTHTIASSPSPTGSTSRRGSRSIQPLEPFSTSESSTMSSETSEWTASSAASEDSRRSFPSRSSTDESPSRSASPDSTRSPSEGTRSWIIYVLGGSYPENHPILTTPSLFTDTPTYEDMMLLSSLIAPAKPPVASRDDIESAGGLFTVQIGEISDESIGEDAAVIRLHAGERCLVCLSDFETGEISRQLIKCQHIFHKDCIDEWLTTGRNSCPLCRGKGVEESPTSENEVPGNGSAASA